MDELSKATAETARTLQVICGALMMGMLTFGAVAIGLNQFGVKQADPQLDFIAWMFMAISLPSIVATQIVAGQTKSRMLESGQQLRELIGPYQSGSIIGWAGLEGAAFMNLVGFLLTGNWFSLVIPALALAWMAATFPTASGLENWLREKQLQG